MKHLKNIPVRKFESRDKATSFEGFHVRTIQALLNGKDLVQDIHRHDFFLVLVLDNAKGSHEIDFVPYKVGNQTIFIVRPGQVHQLTLKAKSTGYIITFKPAFYHSLVKASNLVNSAGHKSIYNFNSASFKRVLSVVTLIYDEFANKAVGYQQAIKAHLQVLFIDLLRQKQNTTGEMTDDSSYLQQRLEEFMELLESHVHIQKQVHQYAEMMHMSPYQLNSITKTGVGKTCSELIDEYIILEAKRQLLATSNQVSQIALQLGYEDVSYFIRFFKKHTGNSPEAFRNNFR